YGANANGALTFLDCGSVQVESASVRCVGGAPRGVASVMVRNTAAAPGSSARILDNDLEVGHLQTGLLLVNVDHGWVGGNLIRAGSRPADAVLLQDVNYRGALRRQILPNPPPAPHPAPPLP